MTTLVPLRFATAMLTAFSRVGPPDASTTCKSRGAPAAGQRGDFAERNRYAAVQRDRSVRDVGAERNGAPGLKVGARDPVGGVACRLSPFSRSAASMSAKPRP